MRRALKRALILDIETTGLKVAEGHRMTEVACLEMVDGILTGNHYHQYINPERDLDEAASRITGLSWDFLRQYPTFQQIVPDFLRFLGDGHLIIHNAPFDMSFINYQLAMTGKDKIDKSRVIDTLPMARAKFPGRPNSLDALCERFNFSLDTREFHGALIDVHLLARVYVELTGGAQQKFQLMTQESNESGVLKQPSVNFPKRTLKKADEQKHQEFLQENLVNNKW